MEQVMEFIKANPGCTKEAITTATGIKGLQLFNILKKALNEKLISSEGEGNETTYILVEASIEETNPSETKEGATKNKNEGEGNSEQKEDAENTGDLIVNGDETKSLGEEKTETKDAAKEKDNIIPAINASTSGRDNSKLSLNGGEPLGKGPFVRHLLTVYAEQHNPTYKQLKEVFPDTLLKRFGIFQDEAKAKEISGKRPRYFMKPEQLIKLKDKKVAVCSQFTFDNIQPFLKAARELGYDIK